MKELYLTWMNNGKTEDFCKKLNMNNVCEGNKANSILYQVMHEL